MEMQTLRRAAIGAVIAVAASVSLASAQTPWVLIGRKAAQRVQHMEVESETPNAPRHDFATVVLEAPADKVYATALDLARKNRQVLVLMTDPAGRRLQLAEGDRVATINVVEFSPEVSQLMIAGTAGANEAPTASTVVSAVLRVCAEMKKECRVER